MVRPAAPAVRQEWMLPLDGWNPADRRVGRQDFDHGLGPIQIPPIPVQRRRDEMGRIGGDGGRIRLSIASGREIPWASGLQRGTMADAINLAARLATFDEKWSPRTIASFNGHDVMVVKVEGRFTWHSHADTDDFFLVISGEIDIQLRDDTVTLKAGEIFVVPRGVEHCPFARTEAHLMLIEPTGTPNTGNADTAADRKVI